MPELSGIELSRRVSGDPRPHPYVVLLTGPLERDRTRLDAGADADEVLAKPLARIDLEVMLSRAGSVLDRRDRSAGRVRAVLKNRYARRCIRCATAAACVRLRTPSLARIRDTCTLAVFSAMNSAAPICRFVAPSAISAST